MKVKETKAPPPPKVLTAEIQGKEQNYLVDIVIVRLIFAITLTLVAYFIQPFGSSGLYTIVLGLASAVGIIYFEHRLKRATLKMTPRSTPRSRTSSRPSATGCT